MQRRSLLRAGGLAGIGALAGCSALASGPPPVDPHTGLDADPSRELDDTPVHRAGDADDLPDPPSTASSLDRAEVALATPNASTAPLAEAFADGTTVAFAGTGAPGALDALLSAVGDRYHYGVETVVGRPVETVVGVPRGDTAATFQFVREGRFDDPVLDPVGWALHARVPDCDTFVPERSGGVQFSPLGSAWLAGRLDTGETYAARTVASVYAGDGGVERLRLRTALHAAATGGYAVSEARRVADFPNDEENLDWFPNPHHRDGVRVANRSDPVEERLDVSFSPTTDRARAALTGCCGVTTGGLYGYDHRTSWTWERDGLLGSDRRHGGGSGRGEWHVHP